MVTEETRLLEVDVVDDVEEGFVLVPGFAKFTENGKRGLPIWPNAT